MILRVTVILAVIVGAGCDLTDPCEEGAQILPHLSPFRLCGQGAGELERSSFQIILSNPGCRTLNLQRAEVRGDDRCVFGVPEFDTKKVEPGEGAFVRFTYQPLEPGEDQVALVVLSDAENFPELVIPVCGAGVDESVEGTECREHSECSVGYECLGVTVDGDRLYCDGSQDDGIDCNCKLVCSSCQVPDGAAVNSACGAE